MILNLWWGKRSRHDKLLLKKRLLILPRIFPPTYVHRIIKRFNVFLDVNTSNNLSMGCCTLTAAAGPCLLWKQDFMKRPSSSICLAVCTVLIFENRHELFCAESCQWRERDASHRRFLPPIISYTFGLLSSTETERSRGVSKKLCQAFWLASHQASK